MVLHFRPSTTNSTCIVGFILYRFHLQLTIFAFMYFAKKLIIHAPTAAEWIGFTPLFCCFFSDDISKTDAAIGSPNLTYNCSTLSLGNPFILGSGGQRSSSQRLCSLGLQIQRNVAAVAAYVS